MQSFEVNLRYFIATILPSLIIGASPFTYKDAANWGKHYSGCNGNLQSPIALDVNSKVFKGSPAIKERLKFTNCNNVPSKMTIENTGHTVEMKGDWSGKPPRVSGGPLKGSYVFEKTSFRWAQKEWTKTTDYEPKERKYYLFDLEMHLYFFKVDLKSFKKAETHKDGLAVIKLWLKSSEDDPVITNLERVIHKVRSINSTALMDPFPVASFVYIEKNVSPPFIFYKGSLDYPPCSESVTWFEPMYECNVSKKLMNGFRKIKLEGGDLSNVRPFQPINDRHLDNVYAEQGHNS